MHAHIQKICSHKVVHVPCHICIHTYIHTHTDTYIHTQIHTYTHRYIPHINNTEGDKNHALCSSSFWLRKKKTNKKRRENVHIHTTLQICTTYKLICMGIVLQTCQKKYMFQPPWSSKSTMENLYTCRRYKQACMHAIRATCLWSSTLPCHCVWIPPLFLRLANVHVAIYGHSRWDRGSEASLLSAWHGSMQQCVICTSIRFYHPTMLINAMRNSGGAFGRRSSCSGACSCFPWFSRFSWYAIRVKMIANLNLLWRRRQTFWKQRGVPYERNGSLKYPSCMADSLETAASSHVAMMASSPIIGRPRKLIVNRPAIHFDLQISVQRCMMLTVVRANSDHALC